MKVSTDGVLLGAWTHVSGAGTILDVGTGTGVIALMMAQRSEAKITALEIEKNAFDEACFNFEHSPWPERLEAEHISFQQFGKETSQKFDLIISNPPYFENVSKASDQSRSVARHTDRLPFSDLIRNCSGLLTLRGRLAIIIPSAQSSRFILLASDSGLYICRLTHIRPKPGKPYLRDLIEFSREKRITEAEELTIENEVHNQFTDAYKKLTKDFYLAF